MHKKYFIVLSISTATLLLTGCYERGKAIPITQKKPVKKSKVVKIYDFPVLKLSANDNLNNININKNIEKKKTKTTSSSLRFPKMSKKEDTSKNKNIVQSIYKAKIQKRKSTQKVISTPISKDKKIIQKEALRKVIKETKKLQKADKAKLSKKKKSKHTISRGTKSSSSSQIPILGSILKPNISLQNIPIINKILPEPSTASKGRIKAHSQRNTTRSHSKRDTSIPILDGAISHTDGSRAFSGGTSSSNLDMAKIRIETDNYQTNIILDSYKWIGYNTMPTEASAVSGQYFFRYEPSSHRIIGDIRGYNSFSALVKKQDILLQDNPFVKNIYLDRYIGDDGIQFIIELKKDANVNIIDVDDPGSIIIELYPKKRNVVYNP